MLVVLAEFGKLELGIVLKHPTDSPLAGEDEQVVASVILHPLGVVGETQSLGIEALVLDPTDLLICHRRAAKVAAVLVFKSVFKHLKLKHAAPIGKMPGSNTPMMSPA